MGQYKYLYNDKRWLARRVAQLRSQPLCVMCKASGFIRLATVADHIVPHRGNPNLFWYGKLQSLCMTCHNRSRRLVTVLALMFMANRLTPIIRQIASNESGGGCKKRIWNVLEDRW